MTGKEIEFKFRVADEDALDAFAQALGLERKEIGIRRQRNTFFDSADGRLRAQGLSLRLRSDDDRRILTIKGKGVPRSDDGVLLERFEAECDVTTDDAEAILSGALSPLAFIRDSKKKEVVRGLASVESALGDADLSCLGSFENERTTLPEMEIEIEGQVERVVFELDRTSYPNGRVDCEIEAEVGPETDAELVGTCIYALLADVGIEWTPSASKLTRFREILEQDR